jgi:hypothetical protein
MSLGANFSSNHTDKLRENEIRHSALPLAVYDPASLCRGPLQATSVYPSMLLASRQCPQPTPAEFALYPKVAVPSSTRTQILASSIDICDPRQRFNKYQRFQIPTPCQALPQSANMAGKSLPSSRNCNP